MNLVRKAVTNRQFPQMRWSHCSVPCPSTSSPPLTILMGWFRCCFLPLRHAVADERLVDDVGGSEALVLSVSTPEPSTLGLGATHTLYLLC